MADPERLLSLSISCYVDDISIVTPSEPEELTRLELNHDSYFRPPTSREEEPFLLHLAILRRVFTSLVRHNFLISYSKSSLCIGRDEKYKFLGITFENNVASIPEETYRTITTMEPPKNQRQAMKCLGLLQFFGCLITNLRARSKK